MASPVPKTRIQERYRGATQRFEVKMVSPVPKTRISIFLLMSMLIALLTCSGAALAQTAEELSEARAAFQRGIELEQAKNWPGALKAFRQVGLVKMTPQVRYHIALCEEQLGKLVAALGGYELALADAESVGDGVSFKQEVEASVGDLRARIPKVVIERGSGADAAAIELDGVALGESSVGVEVPLDPGPHSLVATAPGYQDYSETIEVVEEETRTVTLELKPAPSDDSAPSASVGADDEGVKDLGGKRYSFYPYVLMGVGGASLITSGVLFMVRSSDLSTLEDNCEKVSANSYSCDTAPDKADLRKRDHRVKTLNYVAPILLGVGVVAAGAGVTLFFLDAQNQGGSAKGGSAKGGSAKGSGGEIALAGAVPGADLGGVSVVGSF
jgi:hypothetical protein